MHPFIEKFLEQPLVYSLWQSPVAKAKMQPIFQMNDLTQVRRVLDVGCGPGTNTGCFIHTGYLGIDINPQYIDKARRKYQKEFLVADVTKVIPEPGNQFDFVLANSFFHHIPDDAVLRILQAMSNLVTADGAVHILDLTLPPEPNLARFLALHDRGRFPRPIEALRALLASVFDLDVEQPYPLYFAGLVGWRMVYFRGRKKSAAAT